MFVTARLLARPVTMECMIMCDVCNSVYKRGLLYNLCESDRTQTLQARLLDTLSHMLLPDKIKPAAMS